MNDAELRQRETIRARHKVRVVESKEEGYGLSKLPGGVYGFTFAPTAEESPVFGTAKYQSFEMHKLTDGTEHLVGFVTKENLEKLENGTADVSVQVYPSPYEQATEIAVVNTDRIAKSKRQPSREAGNYITIDVAPKGTTV